MVGKSWQRELEDTGHSPSEQIERDGRMHASALLPFSILYNLKSPSRAKVPPTIKMGPPKSINIVRTISTGVLRGSSSR